MWWVSILGAVLGVLNAVWNIWRWRRDLAYVAWSVNVPLDSDPANHRNQKVEVTNSGTAAAYNVDVMVLKSTEATAVPSGVTGARDVQPGATISGTVDVAGTTHSFPKVIVRWSRRPTSKQQTIEILNGYHQRKPVRPWRHRLARRLTG